MVGEARCERRSDDGVKIRGVERAPSITLNPVHREGGWTVATRTWGMPIFSERTTLRPAGYVGDRGQAQRRGWGGAKRAVQAIAGRAVARLGTHHGGRG